MNTKKWVILIVAELLFIATLVFTCIFETPTRKTTKVNGIGNTEFMLENNGTIAFNFDTKGQTIVGLQIVCHQKGKPVNEGVMKYRILENGQVIIPDQTVSLALLEQSYARLNLEFYRELCGKYTIQISVQDVSPWDRVLFSWDEKAKTAFAYVNGEFQKGSLSYYFIYEEGTHPYIYDAVLLLVFGNLFLVLYLTRKKGKDEIIDEVA